MSPPPPGPDGLVADRPVAGKVAQAIIVASKVGAGDWLKGQRRPNLGKPGTLNAKR